MIKGEAGATVAARPVNRGSGELSGHVSELVRESDEFGDLAFGVGELGGDEVVKPLLDRPAALTVPDANEVGDLLEGAAGLLCPGDERQAGKGVVVVEAVSRLGAGRGVHEADAFVVAEPEAVKPLRSAVSPIV